MSFKILGLAPQIYVTDSSGQSVFYVKQKLFKLKEAVNVFTDSSQSDLQYTIKADRIMDFNAKYTIASAEGTELGKVGRQGMRSIFKASYTILDENDNQVGTITEDAAWKRIIEKMIGEVPLVGFIAIMLINPSYTVKTSDGQELFRLTKEPAFFEGKFTIAKLTDSVPQGHEKRAVLAMLMMALLERSRG